VTQPAGQRECHRVPIGLSDSGVMAFALDDGGTGSQTSDAWSLGGSAALSRHAPAAAVSFGTLISVRPSGVFDALLVDPAVAAFADQFRADVTRIDEPLRSEFADATGHRQLAVAQMVWIGDVAPRLRAALDAIFGPSAWGSARRYPVADVWGVIENFMASVARLDGLDPVTTEMVRLRGARQHNCRICASRRSVAALEAGADEVAFGAVDTHADSDLPAATRAALALTDAIVWTPERIPAGVVEAVRAELTPGQAVEVVLDVVRNAANKIAVALGADAPEVSDGIQLFRTDADGLVSTV
jgi:AhpD family alkylhydroperoxidase